MWPGAAVIFGSLRDGPLLSKYRVPCNCQGCRLLFFLVRKQLGPVLSPPSRIQPQRYGDTSIYPYRIGGWALAL